MALQSSGQISLNDLHVEAGGSSGSECSFNDSDIRDLIDKSSGAQSAMNEFYGASSVTAPVWNGSTYTFDLGTPDTIETKTGNFTLSQGGAVAIIAIGGGGGGGTVPDNDNPKSAMGGAGGGVSIKGIVGTSGMSFTASRGGAGQTGETYTSTYARAAGLAGGNTTVSGNGISLTANGGAGGAIVTSSSTMYGGSASGGDANYAGGNASPIGGNTAGGGGSAGGGNSNTGNYNTTSNASPLDTGWLAPYIGRGGNGGASGNPYYQGSDGSNYGAGGGGGWMYTGGSNEGDGGYGSAGIILVCYWT
jgi:hypothetical protein